jgi:hypothetical protein
MNEMQVLNPLDACGTKDSQRMQVFFFGQVYLVARNSFIEVNK